MTLYLVKGKISLTKYMNRTTKKKEFRLVDADRRDAAERKFRDYFEAKSDLYGDMYTVLDCDVHEIIT